MTKEQGTDDPLVTRAEFEALRATVERLAAPGADHAAAEDGDAFWALEALRVRLQEPSGGVVFAGSVELEPGVPYAWQLGARTEDLLDADWGELAATFDALGHPVRLQLLQLVASGTSRTAELADAEGIGTTGQLHHHLRQLVSAGWLRSSGRGSYEVPPTRVVALLVVVLAAQR